MNGCFSHQWILRDANQYLLFSLVFLGLGIVMLSLAKSTFQGWIPTGLLITGNLDNENLRCFRKFSNLPSACNFCHLFT